MKRILTITLALVLFAGAAQSQSKDTSRHHRKGGHEMMAKELNLSEEQKLKLKSIRASEQKEMKALKDNQSLSKEQAKTQREELHKKYRGQFESVLTSAQKEQLAKQKTEWKGKEGKQGAKKDKHARHNKNGKALNKAGEFGKELNLTQDQKDRMAKMRSEAKSQFESIRNDKSLTEEQKKAKMQTLKKQQHEQMKSILTPEQIEKMKSSRKKPSAKTK